MGLRGMGEYAGTLAGGRSRLCLWTGWAQIMRPTAVNGLSSH